MTENKKNAAKTIAFYALLCVGVFLLEAISSSGPCSIGAGVALFLLSPIAILSLIVWNGVKLANGNRSDAISFSIHICFFLAFCAFFFFIARIN